jgi:hypothetical protein
MHFNVTEIQTQVTVHAYIHMPPILDVFNLADGRAGCRGVVDSACIKVSRRLFSFIIWRVVDRVSGR